MNNPTNPTESTQKAEPTAKPLPKVSLQNPNKLHDLTVHGLIVAAGKGRRFGSELPKQYLPISVDINKTDADKTSSKAINRSATQTILQHSVAKLAQSQYIDSCYLVVAKDDEYAHSLDWVLPVRFAIGGDERWHSVQAGVSAIYADGAKDDDLVLIHDAARPCVQADDIDAVIEVADSEPYGAILATSVADTLKKVSEDATIIATIDRQGLWQAQTPQVFRLGYLQQVLTTVAEQGIHITDEASGFETLGYPVKVVAGSRSNIKLTYSDDLPLLQAILQLQFA